MKESQIQDGYRAWLNKMGLAYIIPTFGRRSTIKASWPDVTIVHCNRALLVEIKTEKGPLKPGQKELFAKLARDSGTVVRVCRSVEECIRVTQEWLGTLEYAELADKAIEEAHRRMEKQMIEGDGSTPLPMGILSTSAVSILGNKENPVAGVVGGKDGEIFGMKYMLNSSMPKDEVLLDHGNGQDFTIIKNLGKPVNGTERIGSWQGNRWLIRNLDGQETMIRVATAADIARVGVKDLLK